MKFKILTIGIIIWLLFTLDKEAKMNDSLNQKVLNQQKQIEQLNTENEGMIGVIDDLSTKVTATTNRKLELIEPLKKYDKEEYLKLYHQIMSNVQDPPETLQQSFTQAELNRLYNVVEVEAEAGGIDEKANVASVIFNRLYDERFKTSTLSDVLISSQFTSIKSPKFNHIKISDDTILACEYAFEIEDTTKGCVFFDSCKEKNGCVFTDAIGHHFYK